jgi:mRNA-degrading endonuclease toxin of MazEF toxin-antitoxin module
MTIVATIPDLPTPPTRTDLGTFEARADAFMSFLPTWHSALNTFGAQVSTTASAVNAAVLAAEAARDVAVDQGDATLYSAGTAYLLPDTVIGTDGVAYRCLKTGTGITGDNPVTSTSGYWLPLTPKRFVTLYVDSLSGSDVNSGLSMARAFQTLDYALALVTGSNSINALIYLASDRTDYTLSSRRSVYGSSLAINKHPPPGGRSDGIPTITQVSSKDGVNSMPCLVLTGSVVSSNCNWVTAASIPGGTSSYYTAVFQTVPNGGGCNGVVLADATTTLRATDLVRNHGGLMSLSVGGILSRASNLTSCLLALSPNGCGQLTARNTTRTDGRALSTYVSGVVNHPATTIPRNLLCNLSLV